ncbi:ANKUB1 [Bugula neritina]|uniref:ANKUB1 n=1 Tax=Bugula neritina TaxID=10212 RepID=A0A7J7K6A9_BUGNE|nr:ANKUB1 [Bugula neritina]
MRALVNYNITAITCKNAFDKTPFQVALMGKQRATAGFLLGKQWSRIQYGPVSDGISLPLNIYAKLKNWCERAKDRHYHNHGPAKSTLKRRPYITMSGPLVGIGVLVDGYSQSRMNGRSTPTQEKSPDRSFMILPSDRLHVPPKQYFKSINNPPVKQAKAEPKLLDFHKEVSKDLPCIAKASKGANNKPDNTITEEDDSHYHMSAVRLANQVEESQDRARTTTSANSTAVGEKLVSIDTGNDAKSQTGGNKQNKRKVPNPVESQKLPQISDNRQSRASNVGPTGAKGKENEGHYIETGKKEENKEPDKNKAKTKSKTEEKKERMVISAMKKAKIKTVEYSIPLPLINTENTSRPYLQHCKSKENDPALSTLTLYEKHRGLKSRDYAIKCLSIASNFKEKPWLQQVRLAMDLTSQEVKKRVSTGSFKS